VTVVGRHLERRTTTFAAAFTPRVPCVPGHANCYSWLVAGLVPDIAVPTWPLHIPLRTSRANTFPGRVTRVTFPYTPTAPSQGRFSVAYGWDTYLPQTADATSLPRTTSTRLVVRLVRMDGCGSGRDLRWLMPFTYTARFHRTPDSRTGWDSWTLVPRTAHLYRPSGAAERLFCCSTHHTPPRLTTHHRCGTLHTDKTITISLPRVDHSALRTTTLHLPTACLHHTPLPHHLPAHTLSHGLRFHAFTRI